MKQFNKTKIAAAVGTAALAMSLGAPANAAISLGGDNGWEVTYGGFINLFYTQSSWDDLDIDSAHLQEGLLPAFHTLTAKSPTVNGLTGTGQITFAPDSSSGKTTRNDKRGDSIDMREVFFNVDGSFGTISAGRTLGLFQRQAILKDYTLFGVGAVGGPDGGGTTLGRIGFGYVYPAFRTRFVYMTPNINGFQMSLGVFDPQHPMSPGGFGPDFDDDLGDLATVGARAETDTPQFQGEATYTTAFAGGSVTAWGGFLWQEMEITSSFVADGNSSVQRGGTGDIESWGVNLGLDATFGGFNVAGSWYTGEALGTALFNANMGDGFACDTSTSADFFNTGSCTEADNDGWYVQGSYTFNGKTKVGVSYGESNQDSVNAGRPDFPDAGEGAFGEHEAEMWTVGVYHDVNSWLKLVAEYSDQESTGPGLVGGLGEAQVFSVGGFLLW